MTPLHYLAKTAEISTKEIMKMLIDAGSEAMAIDRQRNTILHFAMGAEFAHGAYFRVNHCDINVNVRNHSGDTPLHCCVTAEHVHLLLRKEPTLTLRTVKAKQPSIYSRKNTATRWCVCWCRMDVM